MTFASPVTGPRPFWQIGGMAEIPTVGKKAPAITLIDHHGEKWKLTEQAGKSVLVYFYPKADTPGCTTQSCAMRDVAGDVGDSVIVGISPDAPEKLAKFDAKHGLGFTLLSDPDHVVAERFGVWGEKKLYGRATGAVRRTRAPSAP